MPRRCARSAQSASRLGHVGRAVIKPAAADAYRGAWANFYTPDHIRTILRRAAQSKVGRPGTTLTTIYRRENARVNALLGLPERWDTAALIPLGYPEGKWGTAARQPRRRSRASRSAAAVSGRHVFRGAGPPRGRCRW